MFLFTAQASFSLFTCVSRNFGLPGSSISFSPCCKNSSTVFFLFSINLRTAECQPVNIVYFHCVCCVNCFRCECRYTVALDWVKNNVLDGTFCGEAQHGKTLVQFHVMKIKLLTWLLTRVCQWIPQWHRGQESWYLGHFLSAGHRWTQICWQGCHRTHNTSRISARSSASFTPLKGSSRSSNGGQDFQFINQLLGF